ncbi:MAG: hypothetical protein JOZ03_02670 [Gammaproteobacteria bacterium]|nr:hypothetical protein [Gammaproteobacteria bacterium]
MRRPYLYVPALGVLVLLAAGVLYFALRFPPSHALPHTVSAAAAGTSGESMDAAVAGLEARLARGGGSDADWDLLARAYDFQGRPEDARRARAKLVSPSTAPPLTPSALAAQAASLEGPAPRAEAGAPERSAPPTDAAGWLKLADARRGQHDYAGARDAYGHAIGLKAMTAQSWADYADVLASLAGGSLGGAAGEAIDQALVLDPHNIKALWLKASQAHEQHRYREALADWRTLQALLPADSPDARIIAGNITEDSELATPGAATQTADVAVAGTVSVDPRLRGRIAPNAVLFIYAKAADAPGPPLAVLRTTAASWPVSFRLDDSMAMLPSRRLSQFDRVVVEARLSRSGQATPQSGDLYTTSAVLKPGAAAALALTIDREIG